jgi:hypothetical protein
MKLAVICAIFVLLGVNEAKEGSAGAIGRLLCGKRPIEGAIIRLWDHDSKYLSFSSLLIAQSSKFNIGKANN